jgi:hypothetical protein
VDPETVIPIVAIISIFILSPMAIAVARLIWRRASTPPPPPAVSDDVARRLVEMQQTMETMALEIERISEGQRFVTRLMSEQPAGALPRGSRGTPAKRGQ